MYYNLKRKINKKHRKEHKNHWEILKGSNIQVFGLSEGKEKENVTAIFQR